MHSARHRRRPGLRERVGELIGRLRARLATLIGGQPMAPPPPYAAYGQDQPRLGRRGRPQAVRRPDYPAYTVAFVLVIVVLGATLFYGLSWAITGDPGAFAGRLLGQPSPAPTARAGGPAGPTASPAGAAATPGGADATPTPAQASSPPAATPAPGATVVPGRRVHRVERGDTLFQIARRYDTTVEAIMAANGFTDRNRTLRIGEELVIPEPGAAPGPTATATPASG